MNKQEANIEAKKIFEDWQKKRKQIEKDAKKNGNWQDVGFDSNEEFIESTDSTEDLEVLEENTEEDVEYMIKATAEVVAYLRSISPVWRDLKEGRRTYVIQ